MDSLGSHLEVVYNLQTFGISARALPFTPNGDVVADLHKQKWEQRRKWEESVSKVKCIGTPMNNDVIFGRGRFIQDHLGNVRFHHVIEEICPRYNQANRDGKTNLTAEIVHSVKESEGRFLKDDGYGWVEVDDKIARQKVSLASKPKKAIQ
jgi:hypothetical protein